MATADVWKLTFILVVIHEFLSSHHVQELKDAARLHLVRCLRCQTADGRDTDVKVGDLGKANAGFDNLELLSTDVHAVECLEGGRVGRGRVEVFGESDTLQMLEEIHIMQVVQNLPSTPLCFGP